MIKSKTKPNVEKRIGATIIDYTIILIFFILYVSYFGSPNDEGGYTVSGLPAAGPLVFWFCYTVLPETFFKATLGHAIFNLRVTSMTGDRVTFLQIFKRHLADMIEIIWCLGLIAYILIRHTQYNQRLGDIWAKTIVFDKTDPEQNNVISSPIS
ncbi:MAG: RDD family protein [Chitinophagaceae bacterium]|nr:RDD family protein [Chitinophagaceae bacterium]